MPSDPRSRGRFVSHLFTRPSALIAAVVLLLILLGCMSIEIGKFGGSSSTTESDGTLCQEGEITLPGNGTREVYYPVPYAHPPNLKVSDTFDHGELCSQEAGSFMVRNTSGLSITVSWKARGMRATPARAVPARPADPGLPPPAPVPVESTEPLGKAR